MQDKLFGSVTSLRYLPIKWKSSALCALGLAIILTTVYFAFPQYHAVQATHESNTAAAGDWPMYMYNVSRSSYNTSETIINASTASNLKPTVLASDNPANPTPIFSQPIVSNGVVYWGSFDGFEHATPISGSTGSWGKYI